MGLRRERDRGGDMELVLIDDGKLDFDRPSATDFSAIPILFDARITTLHSFSPCIKTSISVDGGLTIPHAPTRCLREKVHENIVGSLICLIMRQTSSLANAVSTLEAQRVCNSEESDAEPHSTSTAH